MGDEDRDLCLGGGGVDRKEWQQKIKRMNLMIPLNSKRRGSRCKLKVPACPPG